MNFQLPIKTFLNIGQKFVPVLDIVTSTEKAALQIERLESFNGSCVKAESLRQSISNILLKCAKKNLPSNLTRDQQKALKDLKNDDTIKVVPFDKGVGFAVLKKEAMIEKIEEHFKNAKVVSRDPTKSLVLKFQREISRLKKEEKIDKKLFYSMYPSDATPHNFMVS